MEDTGSMTLHNVILMQTLFRKVLYFWCPYLSTGFQCTTSSSVSADELRFCSRAYKWLFCSFTEEGRVQVKQKKTTLAVSKTIRNIFFPAKADLKYQKIELFLHNHKWDCSCLYRVPSFCVAGIIILCPYLRLLKEGVLLLLNIFSFRL